MIYDMAKDSMNHSIDHLKKGLFKIRAGKASPSMLDGVMVDYYDSMTPLGQVANVNTPDARMIYIQPWEKSMLDPIEKAIINSNLGFNPQNNGELIIINIPPLTEERRKDLVKLAKTEAENAKVGIRNARKDGNTEIKKSDASEDLQKNAEIDIQELTDNFISKVDQIFSTKEKEILTV